LSISVPEEPLPVEIWEISFKNSSDIEQDFTFYPYIEFFLGGAMGAQDEPEWFTETAYSAEKNLIHATVYLPDALKNISTNGWLAPLFDIDGYYLSKTDFFGYGSLATPKAIIHNKVNMSSGKVFGEKTIGVVSRQVKLQPGKNISFKLIIGRTDSSNERDSIVKYFRQPDTIANITKQREKYWDNLYSKNRVSTPDKDFNRWVNVWLKYQEVQAIRCGNGISANSPLMGFRDMLQHAAGNALIEPENSRNIILEALQYQYANGRAVRQWSRKGKHDTRDYRDSPVWIIHALTLYLKETADFAILETQVPFLDKGKGTVLEHAERAIAGLLDDLGPHGLSHIGGGDWFDPFTAIGIKGRGESVMLTMQLIDALNEMSALYKVINLNDQAAELLQQAENLKNAIEQHAWDGDWYIRAFDDNGHPVGDSKQGRMFLNPQIFAVISGCAPAKRISELFQTVDKHLKTDFGYMLHYPPYEKWNPNIGNASILQLRDIAYCHGTAFKIFADTIRGDGNAAYESFKMLCSENPKNHFTKSGAEPHIIPNGYRGITHQHPGQVLYSGFSGTFAWMLRGAIERICGIRADYDGLIIDPQLPDAWNKCSIIRNFRNRQFHIEITRKLIADELHKYDIYVDGSKIKQPGETKIFLNNNESI
jgi:cellobiose phosphorylase